MQLVPKTIFQYIALTAVFILSACNSGNSTNAPSTPVSTGNWVWMSGSNESGESGVYGTKGVSSTNNVPGSRDISISWVDSNDNLWLFGGSPSGVNSLNDLWKYNIASNQWTWISGESASNVNGIYGIMGVPLLNNFPGSRFGGISWITDGNKLWLFGGYGLDDRNIEPGILNDLWMYNTDDNTWVWVSGSKTTNSGGVYGIQGIPSTNNIPGARLGSVSWSDNDQNLWLFGGATNLIGDTMFNDLWKYNIASNEWAWVSGESTTNAIGVYGVQGETASYTVPGARQNAVSWTDNAGNLWLFGGQGKDSNDLTGVLNDLWMYNVTTNQWTWMSGNNMSDQFSVYGTLGIASPNSIPGSRHHQSPIGLLNGASNFWMFGGDGNGATTAGDLNDLWSYNPGINQWTWMGGSTESNAFGIYGIQGVSLSGNMPGARQDAVGWVDSSGDLWIFGGFGNGVSSHGNLNDLWKFQPQ